MRIHKAMVLAVTLATFTACESDTSTEPAPLAESVSAEVQALDLEALGEEIARSSAAQTLVAVRSEITQRARERNVTAEMVREAYGSGDAQTASGLLGLTAKDAAKIQRRLDRAVRDLYREYPILREMAEGKAEDLTCGVNAAAYVLATGRDPALEGGITAQATATDPDCKWIQYFAALSVCTTAGPVLYWPCAYLAVCSFCEGSYVDAACDF